MSNESNDSALKQIRFGSVAIQGLDVQIVGINGTERMNQCFCFDVELVCRNRGVIDQQVLMENPALLGFERQGVLVREIYGMVTSVRQRVRTDVEWDQYTLRLMPRMHRLALTETLDIYMDLTVQEIIQKKLETAGLSKDKDFEFRLRGDHGVREFVVQYKETDLAFVSRLAEHFGISFFFVHDDETDKIIFTDHNEGYPKIAGDFVPFEKGVAGVFEVESTRRQVPGAYIVRDYNYRLPHVNLLSESSIADSKPGYIVEYGTHFKTPDEGKRFAKLRAEEVFARHLVFQGKSTVEGLFPGLVTEIEGHPQGKIELLITEVRHQVRQDSFRATGDMLPYENAFEGIPSDVSYRPPRVTPKPRITGVVTGRIDAAQKTQYAEIDSEGRYRVSFLFDTAQRGEGLASRLVRMAQPHSGAGYGMHFPLRPGTEVLLTFVDGDPDRPIISSTVPNPQTPSPVAQNNNARNIIRTGGNNEINIDDTDGQQRIKMSVPHCDAMFQLGSPNLPEAGAMLSTIGSATTSASESINLFSTVKAGYSDVAKEFADAKIVQFAGGASRLAKCLAAGSKLVDVIADVAKSGAENLKKWSDIASGQTAFDAKVKQASDKADQAKKEKTVQDWRNQQGVQTKREQAATARQDAEVAKADYERAQQSNSSDRELASKQRHAALAESSAKRAEEALRAAETDAAESAKKSEESVARASAESDNVAAEAESNRSAWSEGARKLADDTLGKSTVDGVAGAAKAAEPYVPSAETVKGVNKTATGIAGDVVKKVSAESRKADKANDDAVALGGSAAAAAAGALGGAGRKGAGCPAPAAPLFLGGGQNSAVLWGGATSIVWGGSTVAVASSGNAILGGDSTALLHSKGTAEIAGKGKCLVSSKALVDVCSDAEFKVKSGGRTRMHSNGLFTAGSNGPFKIHSNSTFSAKSSGKMFLDGSTICAKAKSAAVISGKTSAAVTAGTGLNLSGKAVKVNGKSSVEIKSPSVTIDGKAKVVVKSASMESQVSAFSVQSKGGVDLAGKGVKVKGTSVDVKAGKFVVAAGKITLG